MYTTIASKMVWIKPIYLMQKHWYMGYLSIWSITTIPTIGKNWVIGYDYSTIRKMLNHIGNDYSRANDYSRHNDYCTYLIIIGRLIQRLLAAYDYCTAGCIWHYLSLRLFRLLVNIGSDYLMISLTTIRYLIIISSAWATTILIKLSTIWAYDY